MSRCLYKEREILHRDISKGNVLVRMFGEDGKMSASDETGTQPTLEFRSGRHLLDRRCVQLQGYQLLGND